MKLFASSRRHRTELAAVRAEADRLRGQRDEAIDQRDIAVRNRAQILRQLADAGTANRRVHERNLELGRRLSVLSESDPEYAARLERRVARLLKVAARLYAGGHAEKLRANHLQKRLDDALGMPPGGLLDSAPWQPGYQTSTPDAGVRS